MRIRKWNLDEFVDTFDVLRRGGFPWEEIVKSPCEAKWNIIEPGKTGNLYGHPLKEGVFIIVNGQGVLTEDADSAEIVAGDIMYATPFSNYLVKNASQTETLLFLSILWEGVNLWEHQEKQEAKWNNTYSAKKILVFSSPPTPNGDLHLGHLAGPFLSADIYVRSLRMRGREVYQVTGTHDDLSWVAFKAKQSGLNPQEMADEYARLIAQTLKAARIELDHYYRPYNAPYKVELVQEIFKKLYSEGKLITKEAASLYCESCQKYLFEVHVSGRCPHCGQGAGGNGCEECGRPNDCVDLIDPLCRHCGNSPSKRTFKRLFFPLREYETRLKEYFISVKMRTYNRVLCEKMMEDGLPDIAASHVTDWGIPVPIEGFEGQCISAMLGGAFSYLVGSKELADRIGLTDGWKSFWQAEDVEVVQFFGFDNCWCHTIMFPALFMAYDPAIRPPRAFASNKFYYLDGLKFSTSRGHAIWGRELAQKTPTDFMRFYLAYTSPEAEETNFVLSEFDQFVQRELIGKWQSWLRNLGLKLSQEYGGAAPASAIWTEEQSGFYRKLQWSTKEVGIAFQEGVFSPQQVTHVLCDLVSTVRRFAREQDSWGQIANRKDVRRTAVALELLTAKTLALLSAPIMPDFAVRLWRNLGYKTSPLIASWKEVPSWVPANQNIGSLDGLFFPEDTNCLTELEQAKSREAL